MVVKGAPVLFAFSNSPKDLTMLVNDGPKLFVDKIHPNIFVCVRPNNLWVECPFKMLHLLSNVKFSQNMFLLK